MTSFGLKCFWLRRLTFDIARALGQNEAWYAEEYYTWNGGNIDEVDVPSIYPTMNQYITIRLRNVLLCSKKSSPGLVTMNC